ncbi:MAG: hypothetical protein EZS28_051397, partial [Streblomastix strix]
MDILSDLGEISDDFEGFHPIKDNEEVKEADRLKDLDKDKDNGSDKQQDDEPVDSQPTTQIPSRRLLEDIPTPEQLQSTGEIELAMQTAAALLDKHKKEREEQKEREKYKLKDKDNNKDKDKDKDGKESGIRGMVKKESYMSYRALLPLDENAWGMNVEDFDNIEPEKGNKDKDEADQDSDRD